MPLGLVISAGVLVHLLVPRFSRRLDRGWQVAAVVVLAAGLLASAGSRAHSEASAKDVRVERRGDYIQLSASFGEARGWPIGFVREGFHGRRFLLNSLVWAMGLEAALAVAMGVAAVFRLSAHVQAGRYRAVARPGVLWSDAGLVLGGLALGLAVVFVFVATRDPDGWPAVGVLGPLGAALTVGSFTLRRRFRRGLTRWQARTEEPTAEK